MNTASLLEKQARQLPEKTAIVFRDERVSFKELDETINRFAHYFVKQGISSGMKVLLFIQPSVELPATTFALFKIGAIPVFIDPGMGVKNLVRAVSEVVPQAMIGLPLVRILSRVFRKSFSSVHTKLSCVTLRDEAKNESVDFEKYEAPENEMAAILFTSGGTGKPKGVVYTHKIFMTQTRLLQEMFSLTSDDIDCPCFPLFSFFTLAMGMTSCIPEMDSAHPSKTDPKTLVAGMIENHTTFAAGSPAIWTKVADYCNARDITLPYLKYLVMFGAPVAQDMHEKWQKILPNGTTYTPYGATEALPISNISGKEILETTAEKTLVGAGVCVGKAVPSVEVKIFNEDEIIVSGDVVTKKYYHEEEATQASKLFFEEKLWHKVGDVGQIDEEGRIWFWGRKSHVVDVGKKKMYPVPCESVFNQHPQVKRSALVGPCIKGRITPSLVVELKSGSPKLTKGLLRELQKIRDSYEHTLPIECFYLKKSFPVDVRHNIKIDRLELTRWVEEKEKQKGKTHLTS
ncbi:MAG: AMP-binding protein [Coriobacteriaceae bacterium]|jgi:acyl-CoA synthetase (AMP-forming)/AMP-acid ligase II|nr:AMP-binding protein [Coriobacteriaceae bacterium]